jgi:hypothetical protein
VCRQSRAKAGRARPDHNDRSARFKSILWRRLDTHESSKPCR